jgi:CheY-like chemotaxis protein
VSAEDQTQARAEVQPQGLALVIDDELSVRQLTTLMLRRAGFEVLAAADGLEGLALFERHRARVRVVVLDLTMPRMGGLETLAAIRRLEPRTPVLLCSGWCEPDELAQLQRHAAVRFLRKPYQLDTLVGEIRALF